MSTSIAKRENETPPQALARILQAGQKQIEAAVGDAMAPQFMIRLAVTALHQAPELQNCSMVSIVNSVMLAAQLRLEVNTSLGHAWLIPYKKVCTFQPGYRGLIELAHRSNEVHDVGAHVVYERDTFELEYGDSPRCLHKPALSQRGDWIGAYARIRYKNGPPSTLFMPRPEIEEIRDKSSQAASSTFSPWKTFPAEMIRKTPTKRHLKYCRLTIQDLSRAVGLDDQADAVAAGEAPHSYRSDIAGQELAIEGELLDMAEEATHNLRGSVEQQEEVARQKLQAAGARNQQTPEAEQRDLTPEENRKLDREIHDQEQRLAEAQEKAQQAHAGLPSGGRRKLF